MVTMQKDSVAYIETVGALAQRGVVLLNKVPADLVFGDLGGSGLLCGLGGRLLARREIGGTGGVAVLVTLRRIVAIDRAG